MKKTIVFLILSFNLKALAIELGPFEVTYTFCKDTQKIGTILNAFQLSQWPVAGLPGIVVGVTQRTSPIVDLCSYLTQVKNADTAEAIYLSAEKLNTITKAGIDDELALTKATFRLANSHYDFSKGKRRAASLDAVYTADSIGQYMRKLNKYQSRKKTEQEEREQQEEIVKLAQLSRDRAIIKEAINCPEPKTESDFSEIFDKEYQPLFSRRDYYQKDVEFLTSQLQLLAPRFVKNVTQWKDYNQKLQSMIDSGATYKTAIRREQVKTFKKSDVPNERGEFTMNPTTLTRDVQYWSATTNNGVFSEFESTFVYQWREFVNTKFGDAKRIDNTRARSLNMHWKVEHTPEIEKEKEVMAEFADIANDCNIARLNGVNHDELDPEQKYRAEEKKKQCDENRSLVDKSRALALLSYYVRELKTSLKLYKDYNSKIWTLESKYSGRNRVVTVNKTNEVSKEEVVCSDELSVADMQLLAVKSQAVNAALNEALVTENMKLAILAENEEKREQEKREEEQARKEMALQQAQESARNSGMMPKSGEF